MYEEVCLLCGRPTAAEGRAYCSDECESRDLTSPSISTTSSAYPSPHLHSSSNAPGTLAEVPALLSSALGVPLRSHGAHRSQRYSVSSSSNSSVGWSVPDDDYDDESVSPALYSATDDESGIRPDYLHPDFGSSKGSTFGRLTHNPPGSLSYVRRPSSTNHHSTVPSLYHRHSSNSTPSSTGYAVSRSVPHSSAEDDSSDVPSSAGLPSSRSSRRQGRKSAGATTPSESEREKEQDTVTNKNKRNRASLPAYFSLLTTTAPSSPRSQKTTSSLHTLSAISRSMKPTSPSSPPTPRIAHPLLDTVPAFGHAQQARINKAQTTPVEPAPRGRSRRRDPDGRSSSSARGSPPRVDPPRPHHTHSHVGAHSRARLDSMEKVADWVAHSPVVAASVRARMHHGRRNSSPPPLPKFEKPREPAFDTEGFVESAMEELSEDDDEDARGRRRPDELDRVPVAVGKVAPGYGNGRSGLIAREPRERGRATVKR